MDLSFNRIRVVEGLGQLIHLETLYLASNKIQELPSAEMGKLVELRVLEVGANELSVLDNALMKNVNLEQLYLSRNRIRLMYGLDTLANLRILALQNNQIERIEGLEQLRSLEELYLSNNRLQQIGGLDHNENLRVLDVANNMISSLDGVGHLVELEEFWANNNKIDSFEELKKLSPCTKITSVYFEGNSIASKSRYVAIIREYLPSLRQIDASIIRWE